MFIFLQVCGETGRSFTYAKLRDHSAALAVQYQQKFHLNQGDVVAMCLPNIPEYPIATFGAIEAGLVVTTINPIYTAGMSGHIVGEEAFLTLPVCRGN